MYPISITDFSDFLSLSYYEYPCGMEPFTV